MNHQAALAALARAGGWRKSSYSQGDSACVEITESVPGWIGIRDGKLGADSPILAFRTAEWDALVAAIHAGEITG
jgi:hypothetical protein